MRTKLQLIRRFLDVFLKIEGMESNTKSSIIWFIQNILNMEGLTNGEINEQFPSVMEKALEMYMDEILNAYQAGWEQGDVHDEYPFNEYEGTSYAAQYFHKNHIVNDEGRN